MGDIEDAIQEVFQAPHIQVSGDNDCFLSGCFVLALLCSIQFAQLR